MNCAGIATTGTGMESAPGKYNHKPNLWRVACELSKCKNPYGMSDLLLTVAGSVLGEARDSENTGMTNNKKFNRLLNGCGHPRAVYSALLSLGRAGILERPKEGETINT